LGRAGDAATGFAVTAGFAAAAGFVAAAGFAVVSGFGGVSCFATGCGGVGGAACGVAGTDIRVSGSVAAIAFGAVSIDVADDVGVVVPAHRSPK
jgi:hypothetical protein